MSPILMLTTNQFAIMKTLTPRVAPKGRSFPILRAVVTATCLGMLLSQPAQALVGIHTSGFEYDPATGLLVKEIIEPDDSNLCLVKEYQYDAYGNRKQTTTRNCNGSTGEATAPATGSDAVFVARIEKSDYIYNADGSVTVVNTNAVNLTETRIFEATFGKMASLTGPNNLTTTWQYETFGRKKLETRADTTTTAWTYTLQTGVYAAQPNIAYYVAAIVSGQASPTYDYYDMLNRKVLTERRNFASTDWIDEGNTVYNALGQVLNSYLPYETSNYANAKYSTTEYDLLGRTKKQTAPDLSVTRTDYSGLTTVETNDLSQTKTTGRDLIGQVEYIMDAQNKFISFLYDPFGNLATSTDALGNNVTLTYDTRGRKTVMADPDMGTWSYFYNAVGELIRQIDGKNRTVSMTYDSLGRIKSRNELDLISTWVYDTALNGKGQIASVSSDNGYSRTYSYDSLSRLSSTATVVDNPALPYVITTGYDQYSRVDTQTYPTGFAIKNVYNPDGYLSSVVDANAISTVFWAANTLDAMGHLTQQTYGSGVTTITQVYDPATGRLKQQLAGAGNAAQNMSYQFDTLGNLKTRTDAANNLTEIYDYDTLNRIRTATATSGAINTLNSYDYDAIGNLTVQSKKDITANAYLYNYSYTYNISGSSSVQPHAVTSIATLTGTIYGVSNPGYHYDPNGNMDVGAGRTVGWSSFNMPVSMTGCWAGGTTCSTVGFTYSADHERIREVQADQSVVITLSSRYDTGLHFEKKYIAANGVLTGEIEYEHYLYAGNGIMFGRYLTTTATDGVTITSSKTEYYAKDHLGSIVARLDGITGAIVERLSYDVFGKRRYPDGTNDPNGLLNNPDMYHGYTGHEMLDAVGFIHMNGRIYDPSIGRFLSTDPTVPHPGDGQSFNRYSYVLNNPLSLNDPSGFTPEDTSNMCTADNWSQPDPINLGNNNYNSSAMGMNYNPATYSGSDSNNWFSTAGQGGRSYWTESQPSIKDYPLGSLWVPVGDALGLVFNNSINPLTHEEVKMQGAHRAETVFGIAAVLSPMRGEKAAVELEQKAASLLVREAVETDTVGGLRAAGKKDAHHVIQDAAVRDLPGYNTNAAPGIQLEGPSNVSGTQHNIATSVQRQAGGGTYEAERRIGYKAMRRAGVSEDHARAIIRQADGYFRSIGVELDTVTRIPGNR